VIHARTDTVLHGLCARLGLTPLPEAEQRRRVVVSSLPATGKADDGALGTLVVRATDAHGHVPYAFLARAEARLEGQPLRALEVGGDVAAGADALQDQVTFALPPTARAGMCVQLTLCTRRELQEPPFELTHALGNDSRGTSYALSLAVPPPTLEALAEQVASRRQEALAAEQAGEDVAAAELQRAVRQLEAVHELRREMASEVVGGTSSAA